MTIQSKDVIQEVASEVLRKMGYEPTIKVSKDDGAAEGIVCNIELDDPGLLIGQQGKNLAFLQHIIRLLMRKKSKEQIKFVIDVNRYRQDRRETLINLSRKFAQQVAREKRAVVLKPMSAYERRIVHLELVNNNEVETESVGEGETRRIMIKPAGLL